MDIGLVPKGMYRNHCYRSEDLSTVILYSPDHDTSAVGWAFTTIFGIDNSGERDVIGWEDDDSDTRMRACADDNGNFNEKQTEVFIE